MRQLIFFIVSGVCCFFCAGILSSFLCYHYWLPYSVSFWAGFFFGLLSFFVLFCTSKKDYSEKLYQYCFIILGTLVFCIFFILGWLNANNNPYGSLGAVWYRSRIHIDANIRIQSALIVSFLGSMLPGIVFFYLTKVKEKLYFVLTGIQLLLIIAIPIICALIFGYPEVYYNKIDIFH